MRQLAGDISLTERVYAELGAALLRGELEAGQLYSVVEISRQLGVSRTPVREALLRFASEGLVSFERSKGVRILEVSVTDVSDLYGLRLLLEVPSAVLAATSGNTEQIDRMCTAFKAMEAACAAGDELTFQQHDTKFHDAVLQAAGNAQVAEAVGRARSQMRARRMSTTDTRGLAEILEVHRRVHDAIVANDGPAASAAVEDHLVSTRDILINQILSRRQA